jgi:hypothetical protein
VEARAIAVSDWCFQQIPDHVILFEAVLPDLSLKRAVLESMWTGRPALPLLPLLQ